MTANQENYIDRIEELIMQLSLSDKKDKVRGEIESLKTALRHLKTALTN